MTDKEIRIMQEKMQLVIDRMWDRQEYPLINPKTNCEFKTTKETIEQWYDSIPAWNEDSYEQRINNFTLVMDYCNQLWRQLNK
jgi:hypothetical protein